ncbi:hypothetical protein AVEN_117668-1 [Araneus ventricosus]|uniref:Uncharacterized protein n=1 Tax=Araneus ventricosus TaxID=182803 RepID=A0A4Y2UAP6_ARAVE|nr:hypothetical protein AVEN_117668-1 [Araneus ventricosus]
MSFLLLSHITSHCRIGYVIPICCYPTSLRKWYRLRHPHRPLSYITLHCRIGCQPNPAAIPHHRFANGDSYVILICHPTSSANGDSYVILIANPTSLRTVG